jgi:hypothetical protein
MRATGRPVGFRRVLNEVHRFLFEAVGRSLGRLLLARRLAGDALASIEDRVGLDHAAVELASRPCPES